MAEIINLRRARKTRARDAAATEAAANRLRHGETKAVRNRRDAETSRAARVLDGARLDDEARDD